MGANPRKSNCKQSPTLRGRTILHFPSSILALAMSLLTPELLRRLEQFQLLAAHTVLTITNLGLATSRLQFQFRPVK